MTEDKKAKGDKVTPSGVLSVIKETYLHPFEASVVDTQTGKVLERSGSKHKDK
jgi:hypothetical protein